MAATATVQVRITDTDEFKAWVAEVEAQIEELKQERDEWERRYDDLLESIGGVSPR